MKPRPLPPGTCDVTPASRDVLDRRAGNPIIRHVGCCLAIPAIGSPIVARILRNRERRISDARDDTVRSLTGAASERAGREDTSWDAN
jgi:hypothetical protein